MNRTEPLNLSGVALVRWVCLPAIPTGAIGAYATWVTSGREGLVAQAIAAAVVLVVMLVTARIIFSAARRGSRHAALAFVWAGAVRVGLTLALATVAALLAHPPIDVLAIWVGLFYVETLAAEAIWITMALRKDAQRVALGGVDRPAEPLIPAGN